MVIRSLREQERLDAYERAKQWVIGPEPVFNPQALQKPSKYPRWITIAVVSLCFVLLGAAFVPSALRLFESGRVEFCQTVAASQDKCDVVGISTVLLAETGSLVFILALSVISTEQVTVVFRWRISIASVLLWTSTFLSVTIAIIGNAHIGQPWKTGYLFDYLITFSPPLLVLSVGFVLKELLLQTVASRHEQMLMYQQQVLAYKDRKQAPERSKAWWRFYSKALKEALQKANRRKASELQTLTRKDWERLIRLEMKEALFEVTPDDPEAPAEHIWENSDGTWSARLPLTGEIIGTSYKGQRYAQQAVTYHTNKLVAANGVHA